MWVKLERECEKILIVYRKPSLGTHCTWNLRKALQLEQAKKGHLSSAYPTAGNQMPLWGVCRQDLTATPPSMVCDSYPQAQLRQKWRAKDHIQF